MSSTRFNSTVSLQKLTRGINSFLFYIKFLRRRLVCLLLWEIVKTTNFCLSDQNGVLFCLVFCDVGNVVNGRQRVVCRQIPFCSFCCTNCTRWVSMCLNVTAEICPFAPKYLLVDCIFSSCSPDSCSIFGVGSVVVTRGTNPPTTVDYTMDPHPHTK